MKSRIIIILALSLIFSGCGQKRAEDFKPLPFPETAVPGMMTESQDIVEYLALNYWNGLTDTSRDYPCDSSLVSGVKIGDVEQAFADWSYILDAVSRDKADKAVAGLYDKALACERKDSASNVFETFNMLVYKYFYSPNSPMRNEDHYHVYVKRLASYDGLSEEMRGKYEFETRMTGLNRTGTVATDFRFADRSGRIRTLHEIEAPLTLLFFSNPGCEACMEIINVLKGDPQISRMIAGGRLAVLNIYIDEDIQAWRDYMPIYPEEWYNGFDPDFVLRDDTLYNIRAIPSLYLLDADKRVILKDAPESVIFNELTKKRTMVKKELWGKAPDGKEIYLYTMTNGNGASVQLSSVGAGIVSIVVPDRDGNLADVVLGYSDAESYIGDSACFGRVPGRFANRIANGKFTLDGKEYELPVNNGPNHLHGGPEGFHNQIWESREHEGGVEFLYYSEDGEMGYPGALKTVARYDWSDENELRLTFTAESDAPTVINLTNHAYFNLNGEGNGDVLGHTLRLNASEYLPLDRSQIPLGDSEPVAGTPMDFVNEKPIGRDIISKKIRGYDNCWVIDGAVPGQLQFCGELFAPESGRQMAVYTTQPGVQVYTANGMRTKGKGGKSYVSHGGIAIECQNFPDAPNKPEYPSSVLRPGEVYEQAIIFAFSVRPIEG